MADALALRGVTKAYGSTRALDHVDLTVARGEIHALLGGNGSGKSTLIKVLAGVVRPDAGIVRSGDQECEARAITPAVARRMGMRFVHQDIGVFPDLSVAENLCIGRGYATGAARHIRWATVRAEAVARAVRFGLDVDVDAPVRTLAPARRTMLAIARALGDADDTAGIAAGVLVLDEPTASLPDHEVQELHAALRRYAAAGHTILYVSHRLDEVLDVAHRVSVLRDGCHVATEPTAALDEAALVRLVLGHDLAAAPAPALISPVAAGDPPALAWRRVVAGPLAGVDLEVRAGEIVGVAGLLGSGRSELLRAAFGDQPLDAGTIEVDGTTVTLRGPADAMDHGIAYVPEDRSADAAFADLTVATNLSAAQVPRYWRGGRLRHRDEQRDATESIDRYGIVARGGDATLATLSGGNQQKVVLARWLRRAPRVLLLDEPTQGVDVGARAEIHRLVREAAAHGSAVVVVSSDFAELASVADRVVVLAGGRIVATLTGDDLDPRRLTELSYALPEHP